MVTCCMICPDKNDDNYHKGREGVGQKVIEIIIRENDDNDGRTGKQHKVSTMDPLEMRRHDDHHTIRR